MNLELYIQNSNNGKVFDISNLATEITVKDSIEGEAGCLTTIIQKDPNNLLQISNGSIISFIVDKKGFFFGYVFKVGTDSEENYKITAYDQMRYLKNKDVYAFSNMTATDIFRKVCEDKGLRYKVKVDTNYKPEAHLHDGDTLYNIIKYGKDRASLNDNAQYFIRDNFGELTWSEFSYEKTNIQIGGGSLLTDFQYEKSIDEDTYNQIKLYRDNKNTGKRDVWIVKDSDNIKRWGLLQLLEKANDQANASQVREKAENYLKAKNRETETLKLSCEGIVDLVAGRGIKFVLERENINKWMWIKSSTHIFTKYSHVMDLEVEI